MWADITYNNEGACEEAIITTSIGTYFLEFEYACHIDIVSAIERCYMGASDFQKLRDMRNSMGKGELIIAKKQSPTKKESKKENKKMKNILGGFEFGKVTDDKVKASVFGLAILNGDDKYVTYDPKNQTITDVDAFDIDMKGMLYKMPVAIKDIKVGDIIVHNKEYVYVKEVEPKSIYGVAVGRGEKVDIIPTTNMFGFDFITKVISLVDLSGGSASEDNPFGNMIPFMMMGDDGDSNMFETMMMMQMFAGKRDGKTAGGTMDFMNNPMMMIAMMGGKGDSNMKDMMLMMAMMDMKK